jgi:hypothetical protein
MKMISGYKMSKETKRLLMVTPPERLHETKRFMIQAEIAEIKAKHSKPKDNSKPDLEA